MNLLHDLAERYLIFSEEFLSLPSSTIWPVGRSLQHFEWDRTPTLLPVVEQNIGSPDYFGWKTNTFDSPIRGLVPFHLVVFPRLQVIIKASRDSRSKGVPTCCTLEYRGSISWQRAAECCGCRHTRSHSSSTCSLSTPAKGSTIWIIVWPYLLYISISGFHTLEDGRRMLCTPPYSLSSHPSL